MTLLARAGGFLVGRQQGLLVLLLGVLHLSLMAGPGSRFGMVWWLVDVGLFMLWQPFVHAERRLGFSSFASFVLLLAAGLWGYGNWLLLLWAAFVAALVGGRVLFVSHRGTRLFYLFAFAYLLSAVLLHLMPRVVPSPGGEEALLAKVFLWGGPLALALMALMPVRAPTDRQAAGPVDFVYSLFVFLLIAVLVLGALAFMVIQRASYVEALLGTLVVMGGMLLLLGWAWNPRPGFGGVGIFFSRYLLTVGLPFEQWLHRLTEIAENERDPQRFLDRALQQMLELPWVEGGEWSTGGSEGHFGKPGVFEQEFVILSLRLRLYTRYRLSPALVWHFRLLSQLVAEYHLAKLRERELEQVSYLRAVYETGARLTHDVKNLLQSLNNLCYVAQSLDGERSAEIQPLMQRQLPLIVQRLEQTLDKLRRPRGGAGPLLGAESWWNGLQQRYAPQGVVFVADRCLSEAMVPTALFDSAIDNLVQNALEKRQREPGIEIRVEMADGGRLVAVTDSGTPVPAQVESGLFDAPVASESGLGIGLYHAALQAAELGFRLRLAENRPGAVRFELFQPAV
jgi:signal transduction histidine kinase